MRKYIPKKKTTSPPTERLSSSEIVGRYIKKYKARYAKHGDNHEALGWPDPERVAIRHHVMADVIREDGLVTLLDFGCGLAHMLDYVDDDCISYSGLDVTPELLEVCRGKHPDITFYHIDVLKDTEAKQLPSFDYIVANGVFTERLIPYEDMWCYFTSVVRMLFQKASKGIAFNVMSSHVDYERDDLFHVPMDRMANFAIHHLSRNFIFRNDYGSYEYTTYVYH